MTRYVVGVDFGTESARALVAQVETGATLGEAVERYEHGVLDQRLPGGRELPPGWALQHPLDWLTSLERAVRAAVQRAGVDVAEIVGLGLGATACTVLPVSARAEALCLRPDLAGEPHAWPKLWKHHAAQPQADRLNELAVERAVPWLRRYGGTISAEWLFPKALQLLEEAPEIYRQSDLLVEAADWLVWQLTGRLARNACAAGYKATWHHQEGFLAAALLAELHPELPSLTEQKLAGEVAAPGTLVGPLLPDWAARLGLAPGTTVAASMIDAHAGALGAGVAGAGALFLAMGTSNCHMLMAEEERLVPGISGVVADGIVPGLYGYEAGQAGVGDLFAWCATQSLSADLIEEARRRSVSAHVVLSERATALRPAESGLLALDWWNGCRTPLVDASLSGAILGYTLSTSPQAVYRALLEATAFGTRFIVDSFIGAGVPVGQIIVGGGLVQNELLLQIYADVLGRPLAVSGSEQASALGAAMLGAVAAGAHPSIPAAVRSMAPPPRRVVQPDRQFAPIYGALFAAYLRLVDLFGVSAESPLRQLHTIRQEALHRAETVSGDR